MIINGEKLKDGDVFVVEKKIQRSAHWDVGAIFTYSSEKNRLIPDVGVNDCQPSQNYYRLRKLASKPKRKQKQGEEQMSNPINSTVGKVFDKTEDAILVTKHLGKDIPENFISELNIKAHKEEILTEAKRIQTVIDEDNAKTQYVYAE